MMRLLLLLLFLLLAHLLTAATTATDTTTTTPKTTTTTNLFHATANFEATNAAVNVRQEQQQQQQQLPPTFVDILPPTTTTTTTTTTPSTHQRLSLSNEIMQFVEKNKSRSNNINHKNNTNVSNTRTNSSSNSNSSNSSNSNNSSNIDNSDMNNTLMNTLTASFDFNEMDLQKLLIVAASLLLILVTIVGNTLVILSVVTTRRLRTVTNCFVMNLAVTDWLVGTCVMPPAVIYYVVGSWQFGLILCDIWISLDVLLCTGSILSLCAISLDRYLAVTQPLTYSKKHRSKRLALLMIFIVWVTALSITCPPFLGWYEPGRRREGHIVCRYNQNKGYVVFSAMGSFFMPLSVMLYVYLRIGYVLTSRRQRIVRDANSERTAVDHDHDHDHDHNIDGNENFLSESEHFDCMAPKFWRASSGKDASVKCGICSSFVFAERAACPVQQETSFYELVEVPRLAPLIPQHCSIGAAPCAQRAHTLPLCAPYKPCSQSRASFRRETCAAATASSAQGLRPPHAHPHRALRGPAHRAHRGHPQRVAMRVSTTKHETKTAKTLTIVMGGFIACWLPFFVYYLLMPFLPPAAVSEGLMSFLTWVGWINCGINPFIYAFYNPDFRIAFWRLTCRRICKQQQQPNHFAIFRG